MIDQPGYEKALDESRRQLAGGATLEDVLVRLRARDFSQIDCIRAVRDLTGRTLGEAKEAVHFSQAWADRREDNDRLHAALEEGLGQG